MPARANHGGGNQPYSASQQPQAANFPAKPQPPRVPHPDTYLLTDIPCVFLHERGCWSEFKKSLNKCALTWELPDWMTTIVYKKKLNGKTAQLKALTYRCTFLLFKKQEQVMV